MTKRTRVDTSGIGDTLRRLRFAGRFCGAAPDHGERHVRDGGNAEGEEQAVVVEALDKRRVLEHASETGGRGSLEKAWQDRDHPDKYSRYRTPVPAVRVRVAAVQLVELGEVELPPAQDPVVRDHDGCNSTEEAAIAHEPREDVGANVIE